jgi:hypothetical protein
MSPLEAGTVTPCARCSVVNHHRCIASLLRLFEYWDAKRGERRFPSRTDIDPLDFHDLLPNIFLIDVFEREPYFRFRLSGSSVDEIHGEYLTGKSPQDIKTAEVSELIESHFRAVLDDRCPRCDHVFLLARDQTYWHFERLILPLSSDGIVINMLLCGIYQTGGT